jgi:hypothetical protein
MSPRRLRKEVKGVLIAVGAVALIAFSVVGMNLFAKTQVKSIVVWELGRELNLTAESFFERLPLGANPTLTTDLSTVDPMVLGETEIQLVLEDKTYTSTLVIRDTTAPVVEVKDGILEVGQFIEAQALIRSITDLQATTVVYKSTPDFSEVANVNVTVVVTDASGNVTEVKAEVSVVNDLTPPQITMLGPLYVQLNTTNPDYWAYTTVTDAKSGLDSTSVDDTDVVLAAYGTFTVILKAVDQDGNETALERPVVVAANATVLTMNAMADPANQKATDYAKAVYADLVTDGMTDRQKLRAIYDFLLDEMSYRSDTSNDYNVDNYNKLDEYAKYAFENMVGNCFYYASMAAELIQEGGFEITLIKGEGYSRTEPDHFLLHYWLLVRVDGKLYHFDPLYEQLYEGKRQFFLVTDSDIYGSSHQWIKADYPPTN